VNKVLVGLSLLISMAASAENESTYLGVGYHMGDYKEDGVPSANPSALKIEAGKYLADNVAVEAHFILGIAEDTITYQGTDIDLEVTNAMSLFLKGDVPLSEKAQVYGLIGVSKGKLQAEIPSMGYSTSEEDSGLSYGLGLDVEVSSGVKLGGEYVVYLSEDNYDYTGINLGISKTF
jgi:opacity protein-like surface antigen